MQKYGDIIARMKEIVEISNAKAAEFPQSVDAKDYNEHFVRILWRDIDKDLAKEYQDLVEAERVFYLIQCNKESSSKNSQLIALCKQNIQSKSEHSSDYVQLLELLENSVNKYPYELSEFKGYFMRKEDRNLFIALCRKLKVGPFIKASELSPDVINNEIQLSIQRKRNQYTRLNRYLGKPRENISQNFTEVSIPSEFNDVIRCGLTGKLTSDMVVELANIYDPMKFDLLLDDLKKWNIFSSDEIDEISNKSSSIITRVIESKQTTKETKIVEAFPDEFNELIYWGLIGKLTPDMVLELTTIYEPEKINLLLDDIEKWKIFSPDVMATLRRRASANLIPLSNTDKIITILAPLDGLNPKILEAFISVIGIFEYHYMLDELFKLGSITFEDYIASVKGMIQEPAKK